VGGVSTAPGRCDRPLALPREGESGATAYYAAWLDALEALLAERGLLNHAPPDASACGRSCVTRRDQRGDSGPAFRAKQGGARAGREARHRTKAGLGAATLDLAGCRLVLGRRRVRFTVSVRAAVASRGPFLYRRSHRDSRTSRPRALLELVRRWRRPNRTTALVSARSEAVVSGTRCSCRRERRSGARTGGMLASDLGLL
jgi:hypothetical protein